MIEQCAENEPEEGHEENYKNVLNEVHGDIYNSQEDSQTDQHQTGISSAAKIEKSPPKKTGMAAFFSKRGGKENTDTVENTELKRQKRD